MIQYTFGVVARFFKPDGHAVLEATPPYHLAVLPDDDASVDPQVVWDRFDWGAIMQVLEGADFVRHEAESPVQETD